MKKRQLGHDGPEVGAIAQWSTMPEFSDDRCVSEVLIFNPQALSPVG
jgi:hypothetical protein